MRFVVSVFCRNNLCCDFGTQSQDAINGDCLNGHQEQTCNEMRRLLDGHVEQEDAIPERMVRNDENDEGKVKVSKRRIAEGDDTLYLAVIPKNLGVYCC